MDITNLILQNSDFLKSIAETVKNETANYTDAEKNTFDNLLVGIRELNNSANKQETKIKNENTTNSNNDLSVKSNNQNLKEIKTQNILSPEKNKQIKKTEQVSNNEENTKIISEKITEKNDLDNSNKIEKEIDITDKNNIETEEKTLTTTTNIITNEDELKTDSAKVEELLITKEILAEKTYEVQIFDLQDETTIIDVSEDNGKEYAEKELYNIVENITDENISFTAEENNKTQNVQETKNNETQNNQIAEDLKTEASEAQIIPAKSALIKETVSIETELNTDIYKNTENVSSKNTIKKESDNLLQKPIENVKTDATETINLSQNETDTEIKIFKNTQLQDNNEIQTTDQIKLQNEKDFISSKIDKIIKKIEVELNETDKENELPDSTVKEDLSEALIKVQIESESTQTQVSENTIKPTQNNLNIKNEQSIKIFKEEVSFETGDRDISEESNQEDAGFDLSEDTNNFSQLFDNSNNTETQQFNDINTNISTLKAPENIKNIVRNTAQIAAKSDIINQLSEKFSQLKDGTTTKVNVILQPENLGKVGVELVSRPNGVSARILADTQQVKELLDKNIDTLKNSLASQGVNVNNIVVKAVEGAQGSELNFTQNFNFNNGENAQKQTAAQTDLNSNSERKNPDSTEEKEKAMTNNYENEELSVELKEAQKLYLQHSGQIDLVV